MSESKDSDTASNLQTFPLLPLRDVVVYPQIVQPLFVGREKSIKALEHAMSTDKTVLLVAQKNPTDDEPNASDLYRVGTVASILQLIRLPDGTVKVLVEGISRAEIATINYAEEYFDAQAEELKLSALPKKRVRFTDSISACSVRSVCTAK
jgi:ATP-dependent Lon protease